MGDLGLHPWELWEYTIPEFLAMRKGRMRRERREYQQIRQLAICVLLPNVKKGAKVDIDKLVPDMYEDKPLEKRLTAKDIFQKYVDAGVFDARQLDKHKGGRGDRPESGEERKSRI